MSGHSKWSQIKRQKGVADAKRGQVFTKLGREISVAARQGGADTTSNFRLRLAVQRARAENMPAENIDRAIKRATGGGDGASLEEVMYEGYGPGGVAILVDALTDNRNRTISDLRNVFTKSGGNMAEAGAVAWTFDQKGIISLTVEKADPEELALQVIDSGAEDVKIEEDSIEVHTAPHDLEQVRRSLEEQGIAMESSEMVMVPKISVFLEEKEALQFLRLVDRLEELDDVQKVYFNADFNAEIMEQV